MSEICSYVSLAGYRRGDVDIYGSSSIVLLHQTIEELRGKEYCKDCNECFEREEK